MFPLVSCTMVGMEKNDQERLGREVVARRIELGMRTTKALADQAELSPRMLGDVENGRRSNFSAGAKAQIERALQWRAGSVDRVLAGDEPTPTPPTHRLAPAEFSRAVELARQIINAPPTPHDEHFNRAERLLSHSHESVQAGDHLGAIRGLEGVQSTVELLIDRISDDAINSRHPDPLNDDEGDQDAVSSDTPTEQDAPPEEDENEKTKPSADQPQRRVLPTVPGVGGSVAGGHAS